MRAILLALAVVCAAGPAWGQPAPRDLERLPGVETVLLSKEQQARPGQSNSCGFEGVERWTIRYSPGESIEAALFCPARPEITAFVSCEEKGLDPSGNFVEQFCFTKVPGDADWVPFSFPPNPPTLWPTEFLGVGSTVLLPGDRVYAPSQQAERLADCEQLASRVPRRISRLLQDCYGRTAAFAGEPDYGGCIKIAMEKADEVIAEIEAAGCEIPSRHPSFGELSSAALFGDYYRAVGLADAVARRGVSAALPLQCPCWEGQFPLNLANQIGGLCSRPPNISCNGALTRAALIDFLAPVVLCADDPEHCPGGCFLVGDGVDNLSGLSGQERAICRAEAASILVQNQCCGPQP